MVKRESRSPPQYSLTSPPLRLNRKLAEAAQGILCPHSDHCSKFLVVRSQHFISVSLSPLQSLERDGVAGGGRV